MMGPRLEQGCSSLRAPAKHWAIPREVVPKTQHGAETIPQHHPSSDSELPAIALTLSTDKARG